MPHITITHLHTHTQQSHGCYSSISKLRRLFVMTLFSQIMADAVIDESGLSAEVPESWGQGRTVYGGMQGALVARAMAAKAPADAPLRSLQMTFIGPVTPGLVRVETQLLRQGKSATHIQATVRDGDQVHLSAIGIFARDRQSELHDFPVMEPKRAIEDCFVLPAGAMPPFSQNFEIRPIEGAPPYSGSKTNTGKLYCRYLEEGITSMEHVVGIADLAPPVSTAQLTKRSPGSSMNWHLDLITPVEELTSPWVRLDAHAMASGHGYSWQDTAFWSEDGKLLALGKQCMAIFG